MIKATPKLNVTGLLRLGIKLIILAVGLFILLNLFLGELENNKRKRGLSDAKDHF